MKEHVFHRSYGILIRKFQKYLLPTMITTAALSLNEFADSMLVSNLLGSQAMAVVNLGYPVMLIMTAIETLFGAGGSTFYAVLLGERKGEEAGKVFSLSLSAAFLSGLVITAAGVVFPDLILPLLCQDDTLMAAGFELYFRVLVLSAPVLTLVLTLVEFLPSAGSPNLAMAINVAANGINLIMDYVYIKYFGMGVEGAAWATLSGYIAGAMLLPLAFRNKDRLRVSLAGLSNLRLLGNVIAKGAASAVSQLGFAVKFGVSNALVAVLGGAQGVVAMSLCLQAFSFVAIFYGGAITAASPILALLHGQRDYSGRQHILKTALIYGLAPVLLCVVWFEVAPQQAAAIYSITKPDELALAVTALRIFSLCFVLRGFCIIFMYFLQVLGLNRYAMAISLFDGFGIVPMAAVMCHAFGLDGLWWTYPLNAALLFAGVLFWNRRLAQNSEGRYTGLLLSERSDDALDVCDFTLTGKPEEDAQVGEEVAEYLQEKGMASERAQLVHLFIEEMAVYNALHQGRGEAMDVLLRLYIDRAEIDYRSLGDSCNPLQDNEADDSINIRILRNIASKLEYDYVMGMNSVHIVLELDKEGTN